MFASTRDASTEPPGLWGLAFDGNAFRDQLLEEAGLTARDLIQVRLRYIGDNEGFAESTEVNTLTDVIMRHGNELEEVAMILEVCAEDNAVDAEPELETVEEDEDEETPDEEGVRGIGERVSDFLGNVQHFFGRGGNRRGLQEEYFESEDATEHATDTPSFVPSAAPSLSVVPSAAPSLSVAPSLSAVPSTAFRLGYKTYFGFHIEAGVGLDASYSVLYPLTDEYSRPEDKSASYGRWCVGAELGAGAEVSLIGILVRNRDANDIIGNSLLFEFDAHQVVGIGFSLGVYQSGDMTANGNWRTHLEFSIGAGGGFGAFGGSFCQTSFYTGPLSRENELN